MAALIVSIVALCIPVVHAEGQTATVHWPQFRGPNGSGVADRARPPIRFGPDENVRWKTPIPSGVSSPIVWGDRLFLTAFDNKQLVTLAFDTSDGRELWRRVAPAEEIEECHSISSPAASSPCTDGERVYAYFGSYGVITYDFNGNDVWRRSFKHLPSKYGTASSPILAGGYLILQRDGKGDDSELVALSPVTGETIWKTHRPTGDASYSTPMVWRRGDTEQIMVLGKGRITAYGLDAGESKWWVLGWGFASITTPVVGDGMLYVGGIGMGDPSEPPDPFWEWDRFIRDYDTNQDGQLALEEIPESLMWHIRKEVSRDVPGNLVGVRNILRWFTDRNKDKIISKTEWEEDEAMIKDPLNVDRLVAIRPGGRGDSSDSHVQWGTTQGIPEMPSPLFYCGRVHFIRDGGIWSVIEARTGKRLVDREGLGASGQMIASPVAVNGHIYVVNVRGAFVVLRAGDTVDVVTRGKLGERVRSTPAIAGDGLYIRGQKHLWAFAAGRRP